MTDATAAAGRIPPPPKRSFGSILFDVLLWGGIAALLMISFGPAEMQRFAMLLGGSDRMQEFAREFAQPDFDAWRLYVAKMWETVQIALWGTFLAVIMAVPLGLLCARNIAPAWIVWPMRRLMDILRSVNELVVALLFIVVVGLSPFAGVMALALHTAGVLAKLFSEAVEAIDKGPVEGVRATGGTRLHEIVWGVIPQVAPLWTSFALYRFESNSRSATVLGLIGAGGIGQLLLESLNAFEYGQTSAITIIMVAAVAGIDVLSQAIRKRLL